MKILVTGGASHIGEDPQGIPDNLCADTWRWQPTHPKGFET